MVEARTIDNVSLAGLATEALIIMLIRPEPATETTSQLLKTGKHCQNLSFNPRMRTDIYQRAIEHPIAVSHDEATNQSDIPSLSHCNRRGPSRRFIAHKGSLTDAALTSAIFARTRFDGGPLMFGSMTATTPKCRHKQGFISSDNAGSD